MIGSFIDALPADLLCAASRSWAHIPKVCHNSHISVRRNAFLELRHNLCGLIGIPAFEVVPLAFRGLENKELSGKSQVSIGQGKRSE